MFQLSLALLAFLPAAAPQGKGGGGGWMPPMRQLLANMQFDKLDTDKDGFLSEEEVTKGTFAWLDRNGDKSLDRNELAKLPAEREGGGRGGRDNNKEKDNKDGRDPKGGRDNKDKEKEKGAAMGGGDKPRDGKDAKDPKKDDKKEEPADGKKQNDPAARHMERMDKNHDGKVTIDEFSLPDGWFREADVDGDDKISKEEFRGTAVGGRNGKKMSDLLNKSPEEVFASLDTNKDGKISEDEWTMPKEGFAMADEDGDGTLSKAELTAALERFKKGFGGKGGKKGGKGAGGEDAGGGAKREGKPDGAPPKPKDGEKPPM